MTSRRSTLAFLGVAAGVVVGFQTLPSLLDRFSGMPEFEPLARPEGFREISGGSSSSGAFDPFVGLEAKEDGPSAETIAEVEADLCKALYPDAGDDPSIVPVASFSDYYCPYCRVQMRRLADLAEERESGVTVSWHELPLLGDGSDRAAKAVLAAKRQGAYVAFQEALWTTPFQPTRDYLLRLSDKIGIDGNRLVKDMQSDEVVDELMISKALARTFGFIGTPAMVVGGTVIQGEITEGVLRRLVEIERDEGWHRIC
ncbi:MAG: thioredoxin domain-containing protein [Alphaproteobacteria bacterium]|jgi:protein-disulfide isomerase|nr:thioredoxin domain-containing protein [Alphaproteobacteria bacterium]